MAAKRSKHVRRFLNAATARRREADILLAAGRSAGAVYLAGYAVECGLKALILALVPAHQQPAVIGQFRTAHAHNFDWLRSLHRAYGGAEPPVGVAVAFTIVADWGTDLRYNPREAYTGDTDDFYDAVAVIMEWVERRGS